jgi:hypothetical protein
MRYIRSSLLLQLVKGRDLILFISVYYSKLGLRTRGSHVRPVLLFSSLIPFPLPLSSCCRSPCLLISYPLPPIRNDMHPRRPPHSLRLVTTPLRLKGPSYKHSTSFEDIREFVHDSYGKKGDGGYEGSGMVGFFEEG